LPDYHLLSKIESPNDLNKLTTKELIQLSSEIRDFIINSVSKTGGHFSSNLGIVELTVALHKVFNSPKDKLIFDVGHQCYPHKILTGRKEGFKTNRQYKGMSGFTRRYESPHDFADAGHASTSISTALGILLGEELQGEFNYIIPIIGDAALTGGMAYEALNNLGHLKKKMIVILNDNNMAIDSSVGAISSKLSRMTTTRSYQKFKHFADWTMLHIPFWGKFFYSIVMRWKKSIKTLFYKSNIFTDLGLKYIGPIDGHNINELIRVLTRVKDLDQPVLIHVVTKKGRGYSYSEESPGLYHGVKPFDIKQGVVPSVSNKLTYTQAFSKAIMTLGKENKQIVAITAAMMSGTGLAPFFKQYPKRGFDVGITEEHAVTMAAGMAISGIRPIVSIYSTFIQRSVDQIIHDVAIPGLPVIFTLDRAGIVPADGEAHQGLFDISLFRSVPGMTILAPSTELEMEMMLKYALTLDTPSIIRYSKDYVLDGSEVLDRPLVQGCGVLYPSDSCDILLITYGELVREALLAIDKLSSIDVNAALYSMRFLTPLDKKELERIIKPYDLVVIIEDAIITGGVGEEIMGLSSRETQTVCSIGVSDFLTHGSRAELKKHAGIDSDSIVNFVTSKSEEVRLKRVIEKIKTKW